MLYVLLAILIAPSSAASLVKGIACGGVPAFGALFLPPLAFLLAVKVPASGWT